jgi:hypothetical protein
MSIEFKLTGTFVDKVTRVTMSSATNTIDVPSFQEFEKSGFSVAFNEMETAIIKVRDETIKGVVEQYLEENSQLKVDEAIGRLDPEGPEVKIVSKPYQIEAEIGSLKTTSRKVIVAGETEVDTSVDFFAKIGPREKFHSPRLNELLLKLSSSVSYRTAEEFLNRIRNEEDGVKATTIRNQT